MEPMGKGTTSKWRIKTKEGNGIVNSKKNKHFVKMLWKFFQFLETSCGDVAVTNYWGSSFHTRWKQLIFETMLKFWSHQQSWGHHPNWIDPSSGVIWESSLIRFIVPKGGMKRMMMKGDLYILWILYNMFFNLWWMFVAFNLTVVA